MKFLEQESFWIINNDKVGLKSQISTKTTKTYKYKNRFHKYSEEIGKMESRLMEEPTTTERMTVVGANLYDCP